MVDNQVLDAIEHDIEHQSPQLEWCSLVSSSSPTINGIEPTTGVWIIAYVGEKLIEATDLRQLADDLADLRDVVRSTAKQKDFANWYRVVFPERLEVPLPSDRAHRRAALKQKIDANALALIGERLLPGVPFEYSPQIASTVRESRQFRDLKPAHLDIATWRRMRLYLDEPAEPRRVAHEVARSEVEVRQYQDEVRQLIRMGYLVEAESPATMADSGTGPRLLRRPSSDRLFLLLAGAGHRFSMSPAEYFSATGLFSSNVVMLRDGSDSKYGRGVSFELNSLQSLVAWARGLAEGLGNLEKVFVAGTSHGAAAAYLMAHELGCEAAWAFGWPKGMSLNTPFGTLDVLSTLSEWNGTTTYHYYYCEDHEGDTMAAQQLKQLPHVQLHPVPGNTHHVTEVLRELGWLGEIFPTAPTAEQHASSASPSASGTAPFSGAAPRLEAIVESLAEYFVRSPASAPPDPQADLFNTGQLDSLGLFGYLSYIENTFDIAIPTARLDDRGLRSLLGMAQLVSELLNNNLARKTAIAALPWLPPPPPEILEKLKDPSLLAKLTPEQLQKVSSYALENNQLILLAETLSNADYADQHPTTPAVFTLGLVSTNTTGNIGKILQATALRFGLHLKVVESDFGQVAQVAFSRNARFAAAGLNAVLITLDIHSLPLEATVGDQKQADQAVEQSLDYVRALCEGIHNHYQVPCIVQNLVAERETLGGSLDAQLPGSKLQLVQAFNRGLAEQLKAGIDNLFDVASLAQSIGLERWHDPALWYAAKIPFSLDLQPVYADHCCRIIAASRGKTRRCLVLDLDNTLWGGVIGDDGLDGIVLGQGSARGEAHLALQRAVLRLRQRGVVLAVSSKNNDAIARQPFREHPEMLLRESHIAVFQANWEDKASNIKSIADTLNLGLDAMVLLDDNPAERALVRESLPSVAVPELPDDPAGFADALYSAGYFEGLSFSAEDRKRADYYAANAERVAVQSGAADMASYLKSLDMELSLSPFDEVGRARIVQLIGKTNQFNLTTRRYNDADVREMMHDPDIVTLQARLRDRFGDNGMISVVICRKKPDCLEIDTWLMSCRVLGRRVEEAIFEKLKDCARQLGIGSIQGRYIPTERNGLVKGHYQALGFQPQEAVSEGESLWRYDLSGENGDRRSEIPIRCLADSLSCLGKD